MNRPTRPSYDKKQIFACKDEVVLETNGTIRCLFVHNNTLYAKVKEIVEGCKTKKVYDVEKGETVDESTVKAEFYEAPLPNGWELYCYEGDNSVFTMEDTYVKINQRISWLIYHKNQLYGIERSEGSGKNVVRVIIP